MSKVISKTVIQKRHIVLKCPKNYDKTTFVHINSFYKYFNLYHHIISKQHFTITRKC